MDAAALRGICLGFPGAFEDYPFGPETAVFKVRAAVPGGARHEAKMFALSAMDPDDFAVSLKCEPALAEQLRAAHPEITGAWHLNKTALERRPAGRGPAGCDGPGHGRGLLRPRGGHPEPPPAGAAGLGPAGPRATAGREGRGSPRGELNYPGIGSTEDGRRRRASTGPRPAPTWARAIATYRRVADGILTWQIQRRSGLRVRTEIRDRGARRPDCQRLRRRPVPDQRALRGRVGPPPGPRRTARSRRASATARCPGHPERGEEAFEVSIDDAGAVTFTITAFSGTPTGSTLPAGPWPGRAQRLITSRYLRSAQELAAGES